MDYKKYPEKNFWYLLSAPLIYSVFIPLIFLDFWLEIYHHVCFPIYGLPLIKRSQYIIFDRHKLKYLPWYDKINCTYCAYGNGFLLYGAAIASATEKYWCGIKHYETRIKALQEEGLGYLEYGDKKGFEEMTKK